MAVCQTAGLIGVLTTDVGQSGWYETLNRPSFAPPNWLFGPVWTLLYTLMGVAAWQVWRQGWARPEVRSALLLFAVQLALNAVWSPMFFGAQRIDLAFVLIVLLVVAIVVTLRRFWAISQPAGWLLVPYLLWVAFATVLNGGYWYLNR